MYLLKCEEPKFSGTGISKFDNKLIRQVNGRGARNCENYTGAVPKCMANKWKVTLAKQDATSSGVMYAPQAPIA
jgi:hypothetical protein